ncbi:MAG: hypothetical protein E5X52_33910, partial [Mesorhizobium sp.]
PETGGGIISESGGDQFSEQGGEIISEQGGDIPRNQQYERKNLAWDFRFPKPGREPWLSSASISSACLRTVGAVVTRVRHVVSLCRRLLPSIKAFAALDSAYK